MADVILLRASPLRQVTSCIPFESSLLGKKIGHPLLASFRNSLLAFTDYLVEYFHSIIRDQTSPHSTPEQITKTCRSIFASKQRQANFRQTFLPPKNFLLSRNQLKSSKLKAAEVLKLSSKIFSINLIAATQLNLQLERSGSGCCLFCSEKKLSLIRYFHGDFTYLQMKSVSLILLGNATSPIVNGKVFKGCGHSFHVTCVPNSACPTCQEGIRRRVRENARKAKQAIFSQSPTEGKAATNPSANAQDPSDEDEAGLPDGNEKDVEERSRRLNAEIRSWQKYSPSTVGPSVHRQPAPESKQGHQISEKKGSRAPMSCRRFNFRADKAIAEFLEKFCGEKPTERQIKHLLESDIRLAGETFERVKRKISTLMSTKREKMGKDSASVPTVPVPPWEGHFSYEDQNIEIINSCPIDNLLTTFHILCSSNSDFLKAFSNLPYEGARTLLSVHQIFSNQQWVTGKLIWLTQINLGIDLTRKQVNVCRGEKTNDSS